MAINIPALPSVWFLDAGVATSSPTEPSACVCASLRVYFSVFTFQLLSPILSVKLKRKNNSNSNNYNDNKQEEWKKRSIWVLPLR